MLYENICVFVSVIVFWNIVFVNLDWLDFWSINLYDFGWWDNSGNFVYCNGCIIDFVGWCWGLFGDFEYYVFF